MQPTRSTQHSPQSGPGLTRRTILGLGASAAAGLVLTAGARPIGTGPVDRVWDTIVIGAGAAGLGAARRVADAGRSVLVLEARDRIGGRMWTDDTSMSIPFERGAELVHGSHVSTWGLIDELGLQTHRWEQTFGKRHPDEAGWTSAADFETFHFPLGAPSFPAGVPQPLAGETAEVWLTRIGVTRDNYPISVLAIEVDSEQFDVLPANRVVGELEFALEMQQYSGPMPREDYGDYRVIGGYKQVLQPLAAGIPVRLGSRVHAVEYRKNRVDVRVDGHRFKARTVVLALPGGVLKSGAIAFDPPLPPERRDAFQQIVYLPVFKGILEFAEPVIAADAMVPHQWDVLAMFSENPPSIWNASAGTPGFDGQLLVTWMTGGKAQELLDLPEQERHRAGLEVIRRIAGDPTLEYVNASTYDWSKDEFALGAYPGPLSRRSGMNAPIADVLFWAGITTSTVHSSRDSGVAAAEQVLTALAR